MTGTVVVEADDGAAGDDDHGGPSGTDEPDVGELHVHVQPADGDVRVPAGHTGGATGTYAACTSPARVHDDRERQLHVHRPSRAGRDADPDTRHPKFTVDTGPPDTTINGGPSGTVNTTSQSFPFSGTEVGVDVRVPPGHAVRPGHVRGVHVAAGVHDHGQRRLHVLRPRDRRGGQRGPDARVAHVHGRHGRAGHDDHGRSDGHDQRRVAVVRVHVHGDGLDVRVPPRRPGLGDRQYVACTSPRARGPLADGTYTFDVRARDAAGNTDATPATRTLHGRHRRPGHDDHGRPDRADEQHVGVVHVHLDGAGLDVRVPPGPPAAGTFAACTSPQAYTTAGQRRAHLRRPRDRRGRQPRPDARHAHVHGRHRGAGHDDRLAARPARSRRTRRPSRSPRARRARRSSAASTGRPAGTWQSCTSPRILGSLADGTYTFDVRATDAAGNVDATPGHAHLHGRHDGAEHDDRLRPDRHDHDTTSPQFTFSSSEAGSTFECRLDGPGSATGTYALCTSPRTLGPLADGSHTFQVRAIDAAGNVDRRPRRGRSPSTPPRRTRRSRRPDRHDQQRRPRRSRSPRARRARRSSAASTPRRSRPAPRRRPTRRWPQGAHTFEVRARDAAGNVDATPASRTFTVDTAAPDTTITSGPTGPTSSTRPSFAFTSEAGADVRVPPRRRAFAACTSPQAYTDARRRRAHVRGPRRDAAGNVDATPATRTFTVDTTAPDTTINGGPTRRDQHHDGGVHVLRHREPGVTFECRLDAAAFAPCTSPQTYTALAQGEHTF